MRRLLASDEQRLAPPTTSFMGASNCRRERTRPRAQCFAHIRASIRVSTCVIVIVAPQYRPRLLDATTADCCCFKSPRRSAFARSVRGDRLASLASSSRAADDTKAAASANPKSFCGDLVPFDDRRRRRRRRRASISMRFNLLTIATGALLALSAGRANADVQPPTHSDECTSALKACEANIDCIHRLAVLQSAW